MKIVEERQKLRHSTLKQNMERSFENGVNEYNSLSCNDINHYIFKNLGGGVPWWNDWHWKIRMVHANNNGFEEYYCQNTLAGLQKS